MRKYIIFFFSVSLFFAACSGGDVPKDIIAQDRMTNLLIQVHMVDGSLYNLKQDPDTLYKYGTIKYLVLFKKFHTDSAQFRKSLRYYASQPAVLLDMYGKVQDEIKSKTDSLNKLQRKTN